MTLQRQHPGVREDLMETEDEVVKERLRKD
jgi:hypothetical protein